jgi:hypothetical protein
MDHKESRMNPILQAKQAAVWKADQANPESSGWLPADGSRTMLSSTLRSSRIREHPPKTAYSGRFSPAIPFEVVHLFHSMLSTDSVLKLSTFPVIPEWQLIGAKVTLITVGKVSSSIFWRDSTQCQQGGSACAESEKY